MFCRILRRCSVVTCTLILGVLIASSAAVLADDCDCQSPSTVTNAFELADVVFTGRVQEMKTARNLPITAITFEVYQFWKGSIDSSVYELRRADSFRPECNFAFEAGEEYLVFGDQTSFDVYRERYIPPGERILNATKCGRTKLLAHAERDLAVLGPGKIPSR